MSLATNIVLAGVGGQGSVTASQVIARTAGRCGHEVATTEVHGMAQRGGSVYSTVRFGSVVQSPVVPEGAAHVLLGFEKLEALRYARFLRPEGVAVVSTQRIIPIIEALKNAAYPGEGEVESLLRRYAAQVLMVPALEMAAKLGNPKLANSCLLGALAAQLDLAEQVWYQSLGELVPPRTVELNQRLFEQGLAFARQVRLASRPPDQAPA